MYLVVWLVQCSVGFDSNSTAFIFQVSRRKSTVFKLHFLGTVNDQLDKLQRVQNVLARVTAQAPWSVSATDLRRDLHWLPIRQRFIYKLSVLTYNALNIGQPYYLANLIDIYEPSRCLRFTN